MVRKRGFTLIELLVVVSIIALLMAIIMPTLSKARDQAKNATCMTLLRQWGPVFQMYTDDNNGYFNRGWPPSGDEEMEGTFAGGHLWPTTLLPYYRNRKLRFCPMATKAYGEGVPVRFAAWQWQDTENPNPDNWSDELIPQGSYGLNCWIGNNPESRIEGAKWKTPNVRGANNIPLLLDCWWAGGFPEEESEPPAFDGEVTLGGREIVRYIINRHKLAVNSVFVDYSVRRVGLKQLYLVKWHRKFDNITGPWTEGGGCTLGDWPDWMRLSREYE